MAKVIIITGASSGFGKMTAERLASHGHKVYGICRREMQHDKIQYIQLDVREPETIALKVKEIYDKEGRIDVLINNAGMGIGGALELTTKEELETQMNVNFMGCVNMCQKVLPYMRRQRAGKIINLSSIGGIMGLPYQGFYSASKFAIEGFSEALSAEVKGFGISVSMVEPGDFATNFTASRKNSQATMNDPDYGPIFKRSLALIEKEENGGLKPEVLAKKIEKIVDTKHPRLRYVVANLEQWFSVVLKRLIPGNWFVDILVSYYKTKPTPGKKN
ncbi:MAG: SDR family oxidoreductase [Prevotellaceae bacterium]|nr:SDR family oxidoreductase [Candidatus Colivivens equi]